MGVKVYLPVKKMVSVDACTNATWMQRVTFTLEGQKTQVWEGTGEGNQEMGRTTIFAGKAASGASHVEVLVTIEHSKDGGNTWAESRVRKMETGFSDAGGQVIVFAEDGVDRDWNDTVLRFWWLP